MFVDSIQVVKRVITSLFLIKLSNNTSFNSIDCNHWIVCYQPFNIRVLHLFVIVTCHITFIVLVPAAIFASLEPEWDYLDSLYYCFVSLTTVGLGDYIPGDSPNQPYRPLYKVATTGTGVTFKQNKEIWHNEVLWNIPYKNGFMKM